MPQHPPGDIDVNSGFSKLTSERVTNTVVKFNFNIDGLTSIPPYCIKSFPRVRESLFLDENKISKMWLDHRKHFPELYRIARNQWGRVTVWRLSAFFPPDLPRSISGLDFGMDHPGFNAEFNITETRRTEVLGRGLAK